MSSTSSSSSAACAACGETGSTAEAVWSGDVSVDVRIAPVRNGVAASCVTAT
jgi:hypothetical protein